MALSNPVTDAIGQRCAVLKVTGDRTSSNIYYAVRTSAPYTVNDGADIRAGTGAVFTAELPNITRQNALVTGLDSGAVHYWGAVLSSGLAVVEQFTTQAAPEEESGGIPRGGFWL